VLLLFELTMLAEVGAQMKNFNVQAQIAQGKKKTKKNGKA